MQPVNEKEMENIKTFSKALGLVVKRQRKKLKKSIYKISAEVGMAKNSWRLIERAEVMYPSMVTIIKIAEALDMKPFDLLNKVYDELDNDFTIADIS